MIKIRIKNSKRNWIIWKIYRRKYRQKRNVLDIINSGYYSGLNNADELFIKESELIKKVASKESCVIIGRDVQILY